ncbi:GlcG/HbpS family heme-binding protein [Enemella evansiae]|uniref:GlcG/HbpS family heme-binding protein n=1 Tax=Enemella evansiae TaxID=2016499 RepID=UPI001E4389B4|nr:heme-binding protein [Enemella evansiae]
MSETTRNQPNITRAGARTAMDAALARAEELGLAMNIAIADSAGRLVAFERMDGAMPISAGIAQDKAWTVIAGNGLPTADWYETISSDPALKQGFPHRDRLVIFGGGVPITVDGQLVGAVGVSGGSAEEDADVASAGAAAVS